MLSMFVAVYTCFLVPPLITGILMKISSFWKGLNNFHLPSSQDSDVIPNLNLTQGSQNKKVGMGTNQQSSIWVQISELVPEPGS